MWCVRCGEPLVQEGKGWRTTDPPAGPFTPLAGHRTCAGNRTPYGTPHWQDGVREGPHQPAKTGDPLVDSRHPKRRGIVKSVSPEGAQVWWRGIGIKWTHRHFLRVPA